MSVPASEVLSFFDALRRKCAERFPVPARPKLLSFMATASVPGEHVSLSVHALEGLAPGEQPSELQVRLRGSLPRVPRRGECITVCLLNLQNRLGYQVKSFDLVAENLARKLYEQHAGGLTVRGASVFTVHATPNTTKFFEKIPVQQVRDELSGVRFAIVGVGTRANISPRFVVHYRAAEGGLRLFNGEGHANKTFVNVQQNRCERRLVVDLDTFRGYALQGTLDEIDGAAEREGARSALEYFEAGGWGKPRRVYCLRSDAWEAVAPAA